MYSRVTFGTKVLINVAFCIVVSEIIMLLTFYAGIVQVVLPVIVWRTNAPGLSVVTGAEGLNVPRTVPPGY
jgi:hypothetical protein